MSAMKRSLASRLFFMISVVFFMFDQVLSQFNFAIDDWTGLCKTGKSQSPVNIRLVRAVRQEYKPISLINYEQKLKGIQLVNDGRSRLRINGGPLSNEYIVDHVRFHWSAEHLIDNVRHILEVQIVHRNDRYANLNEAGQHKDGLAIISTLYFLTSTINTGLENIMNYVDMVKYSKKINIPVNMKIFKLEWILPEIMGFYTYFGSLTTPACHESVTWIISNQTHPVSLEQMEKLMDIENKNGEKIKKNNRRIYRKNKRLVKRNFVLSKVGSHHNRFCVKKIYLIIFFIFIHLCLTM